MMPTKKPDLSTLKKKERFRSKMKRLGPIKKHNLNLWEDFNN